VSHVLALAASELAALALQRNGSINHQCFRIKNLHADEIVAFTKVWAEKVSLRSSLSSVRLLVTDSLGGQVQPQFVAESDKTITYYRNNNPKGLIYIESSVQSDEQGLQNIFSLRDSNFLDSSFDGYVTEEGGVTGLLVRSAWNNVEESTPLPELLQNLILAVCKQIHPAVETIPVRRFIQFAETAIELWRTHVGSIDGATANQIVGKALVALGMFPDPLWNASASRAKRRLELNLRHAELLDGGTELNAEQIEELARATKFKDEFGVPYPQSEADRKSVV